MESHPVKFRLLSQLETECLLLWQFEDTDWQELHHYNSDAEATAFTDGYALDEGLTWRWRSAPGASVPSITKANRTAFTDIAAAPEHCASMMG